jgi:hypothetical protein
MEVANEAVTPNAVRTDCTHDDAARSIARRSPMFAYTAIPLTCWLCALLAHPHRSLPGNGVAEIVYRRLLGRQQRLLRPGRPPSMSRLYGCP